MATSKSFDAGWTCRRWYNTRRTSSARSGNVNIRIERFYVTPDLDTRLSLLYTLYDHLEYAFLCSLHQFECLFSLLKLESVCNELLHIDLARSHQIHCSWIASH